MTSTYRPPFFFALAPLAPPFLGTAAPSKSSILLAALRLDPVLGLAGGGASPPFAPTGPSPATLAGVETRLGGPEPMGGAAPLAALPGGALPESGGGPMPLGARLGGPARGGGGVAEAAFAASSGPAFLLTHLLSVLSK